MGQEGGEPADGVEEEGVEALVTHDIPYRLQVVDGSAEQQIVGTDLHEARVAVRVHQSAQLRVG